MIEFLEQIAYSMTPTNSGRNWRTEVSDVSQTITTEPAPTGNQGGMVVYENHAQDSRVKEVDIVPCLKARAGTGGGNLPLVQERPQGVDLFNQTLTGDIHVPLRTAGGHGAPAVAEPIAFHATQDPIYNTDFFPTMGTGNKSGTACLGVAEDKTIYGIPGNWIGRKPENGGNATAPMVDTSPCLTSTDRHAVGPVNAEEQEPIMTVRKLTPLECERLQGFPDNYTQIPWNGKDADQCPDGHRYKAMGNSMAVPVMNWIGSRIKAMDTFEWVEQWEE